MNEEKTKTFGKKVFTIIMTVVITLLVLFVVAFSWLLIKNPLNVRGIILFKLGWTDTLVQITSVEKDALQDTSSVNETTGNDNQTDFLDPTKSVTEKNIPTSSISPVPMTSNQRKAVEDFGIDPDSIIITPAMENCFVEKLGQQRVDEIIKGDTPGAFELLKASSCL